MRSGSLRLVAHQGKLDLMFECRDWVEGRRKIRGRKRLLPGRDRSEHHVGADPRRPRSATHHHRAGPERAVSQIVLMDVFERYSHYRAVRIAVSRRHAEGTPGDWQRMADKAAALACSTGLVAGTPSADLRPVRSGQPGRHATAPLAGHLQPRRDTAATSSTAGSPAASRTCGHSHTGHAIGETHLETGGASTWLAPPGLSRVPFTWRTLRTRPGKPMEAIGGLVGVTQELRDSGACGRRSDGRWRCSRSTVSLTRLARAQTTFPARPWSGTTKAAAATCRSAPGPVPVFTTGRTGRNCSAAVPRRPVAW